MTERQALLIAGAGHLALIAALSVALTRTRQPLEVPDTIVPVEFVAIADRAAVPAPPKPAVEAAPPESAAPPAPEPAAQPDPAPPRPAQKPAPPPKPTPKPLPPAPTPDPQPAPAEPKPPKPTPAKPAPSKPTPSKAEAVKPVPPKPAAPGLDTGALSALIDKALPKARRTPLDTSALAKSLEAALPKATRIDPRATATLQAAIRAQIFPCWNPPIGGADVRHMTVTLHVEFARDGSVAARPEVVAQTAASADNAGYARSFADTARRAVLRCAPLKLPADLYDQWKSVDINFDPSAMV